MTMKIALLQAFIILLPTVVFGFLVPRPTISSCSSFPATAAAAPVPQNRPAASLVELHSSSSKPVIDWARTETLDSIVPKDDAIAIVEELLINNDPLIDDFETNANKNWDSLEKRFRDETRTVSELIGDSTKDRLLKTVNTFEYDPTTVRAFLGSNAINNLFAVILYDAIFEFVQKIDIFGNIVNGLPIIGPIRQQITKQFKASLDKSLGPLIKRFLSAYTKVAVGEAIDFVLSPENQKGFGSANVRLISSVIDRPVNSLLPSSDVSDKLRSDVFAYIRNDVNMEDVQTYIDLLYDVTQEKTIEDLVDVDKVLEASPTLQKTLDSIWDKANNNSKSSTSNDSSTINSDSDDDDDE